MAWRWLQEKGFPSSSGLDPLLSACKEKLGLL